MDAITRWMRMLLGAALGAWLAGCGGGSGDSASAPAPASALRLETATAVTQTVGPAGGTLATTAADGTVYTLTVPAKALRSATSITLAPIASIADLPAGVSLAGGAHLTPEGQRFDAPLKLSIALAAAPVSAPVPFTYAGELRQRRLYPARVAGRTIEFEIVHFSGYAALLAAPDVLDLLLGGNAYLPTPSAAGDMALQQLVSASLTLTLTDEARLSAMRAALQGWLDGVIKPAAVAVQAFAAVDVDPPATPALLAMTRLREEMQVFDVALRYAIISGGSGVVDAFDGVVGDFKVAVRDAARHVIPLFNAACDTTAAPILLAVPNALAWQQLAQFLGAAALEPALDRTAVLEALCVQVAYDPNGGTDFPTGIQPGQTGTLGVRAGYSVNGGPVRFDEPMNIAARGTNTSTDPLRGTGEPVAAGASYQQQFQWLAGTSELRIDVAACLQDPALRELCQQAFVVRGTPPACPSFSIARGQAVVTGQTGASLLGSSIDGSFNVLLSTNSDAVSANGRVTYKFSTDDASTAAQSLRVSWRASGAATGFLRVGAQTQALALLPSSFTRVVFAEIFTTVRHGDMLEIELSATVGPVAPPADTVTVLTTAGLRLDYPSSVRLTAVQCP